ncbi:MAG: type II toxin-antitoxin system VapC family toxin [candidate division NC10 bacterium]
MMIADTDVLIDFLQDDQPVARRIEIELERGQLSTTAVTRFELLAGARTIRQQGLIAELLAALPCLPLDETGADRAAEVRRTLEKQGLAIGMGDSLIAGIVLAQRGVLLTRNRRHFERVPDLALGRI